MPNYVALRPTSISTRPRGQLLRSRIVKSDGRWLNDKNEAVRCAEFFLNNLHRTNKDSKEHCLFSTGNTDSTYAIEFSLYGTSITAAFRIPDCLFTAFTSDGVTALAAVILGIAGSAAAHATYAPVAPRESTKGLTCGLALGSILLVPYAWDSIVYRKTRHL